MKTKYQKGEEEKQKSAEVADLLHQEGDIVQVCNFQFITQTIGYNVFTISGINTAMLH